MIIKKIHLTNFRNHSAYRLECSNDTTLILGENGSGKTSVLEAIYILTRGKSFRSVDSEIIKRGTDYYQIEIEYDNGEKIIANYNQKEKTFIVSEKKSRRLPKKSRYPIVLFLPSDLNLVSGSPSRHREYFDRFFSQINEEYSSCLSKYEKALKQRNELLKNENHSRADLFSWNMLLAKYGSSIFKLRKLFTEEVNQNLEEIYHSIANNKDEVVLLYQTEIIDSSEEKYLKILEQNYEKDKYLGHTSFGIHKDDFKFIFNSCEANGSASRGETRSIILALKFIEANIILDRTGQKPIVLLDDVFSELDENHRKCLVTNFKDYQVILTSVEQVDPQNIKD